MPIFSPKKLLSSKGRIRTVATFLAVIVVFLILNQFTFFKPVTQGTQHVLFTIGDGVGNIYQRIFTSSDSLNARLEEAESKAAALSIEKARLNQLEHELNELHSLLNYKETVEQKTYSARILARSIESEESFLIDKGESDGLREGLAVVVENGHLIGILSKVQRNTSVVKLISDQTSKVPSTILSKEETIGLSEGKGGFLLEMDFIPHDQEIEVNQIVITSGLETQIPRGLIIGSVFEVMRIDTELFVKASIQPFIDTANYQQVLIIDPLANTEYGS